MNDLKSKYYKIEEPFNKWLENSSDINKSGQFYRLVKETRIKVRERSLSESLDRNLYEDRLYTLKDFLSELLSALNQYSEKKPVEKKNEGHVWTHRDPYKTSSFVKKYDEYEIDREHLLLMAAKYLKNPWLQHDQIDWILIDSLIFVEISTYRESIFSGHALGNPNWAYIFYGGDIEKTYLFQLKKTIGFFALRYIVPPLIIFLLYYAQYETVSLIAGKIYVVYLLFYTVLWPFRYRKRKLEQQTLKEHTDRLQNMINAYSYCKPPILSLSTLQSYLHKAVEVGAMFDGALFSVLKRVEANSGEAFLPFTEPE